MNRKQSLLHISFTFALTMAAALASERWTTSVLPYLGNTNSSQLITVLTQGRAVGCPALRSPNVGANCFGVNDRLCYDRNPDSLPYRARALREVRHPEITFLVADCYTSVPTTPTMLDWTGFTDFWWIQPYGARHAGMGLNFVFVDGHGEFIPSAQPNNTGKGWYLSTPPGVNTVWSDTVASGIFTYWCLSGGFAFWGWEP